jgi:DNA-binding NarL/FixJ family response regulator
MRQLSIPLRLVIADKALMYAEGLRDFLRLKTKVESIRIVSSNAALRDSMREHQPDAIIVEPWTVRDDSGYTDLQLLLTLRVLYPHCHIVVFTAETDPSVLRKMAELESVGLSSKADDPEDVLNVLECVVGGRHGVMSPRVAAQIASANLLIQRDMPVYGQQARTPDI